MKPNTFLQQSIRRIQKDRKEYAPLNFAAACGAIKGFESIKLIDGCTADVWYELAELAFDRKTAPRRKVRK